MVTKAVKLRIFRFISLFYLYSHEVIRRVLIYKTINTKKASRVCDSLNSFIGLIFGYVVVVNGGICEI